MFISRETLPKKLPAVFKAEFPCRQVFLNIFPTVFEDLEDLMFCDNESSEPTKKQEILSSFTRNKNGLIFFRLIINRKEHRLVSPKTFCYMPSKTVTQMQISHCAKKKEVLLHSFSANQLKLSGQKQLDCFYVCAWP